MICPPTGYPDPAADAEQGLLEALIIVARLPTDALTPTRVDQILMTGATTGAA